MNSLIKSFKKTKIHGKLSLLFESMATMLLSQGDIKPAKEVLKYFFCDYFVATTILVSIFVLIDFFYISKITGSIKTFYSQFYIGATTFLISACSFHIISKTYMPGFGTFVSFIVLENTLAFKICIIVNALNFLYLLHCFILPKYDPCPPIFVLLSILFFLIFNLVMWGVYTFLFLFSSLPKFTDGLFTGFFIIYSPILAFIMQICTYICLNSFMSFSESLKIFVRRRASENRDRMNLKTDDIY